MGGANRMFEVMQNPQGTRVLFLGRCSRRSGGTAKLEEVKASGSHSRVALQAQVCLCQAADRCPHSLSQPASIQLLTTLYPL